MRTLLHRLFGVDSKGRPGLPNSRRQILIGGLVCLGIWPGIAVLLLAIGELDAAESGYVFVSPWIFVTLLGLYLIGQALVATEEWPRFKKSKKKSSNRKGK